MAERRYASPPPGTCITRTIEGLTILFHRPSGATHILAEPAPQILDALAGAPLSEAQLLAKLAESYEVLQAGAITARLAELAEAGLVATL